MPAHVRRLDPDGIAAERAIEPAHRALNGLALAARRRPAAIWGGDGEMPATCWACRAGPGRCIARDSDTGTAVTWARAARGSLRWRCAWLPFIARLCEHGVRDGQSGPEGEGLMARLRALAAAASIASMVFTVGSGLPASAGTATGGSAYRKAAWGEKILSASSPGFHPPPRPG